MKTLITACLLLTTMTLSAQELNKKITDNSRGQEILINQCTREGLTTFAGYKPSYDMNYGNYKPDSVQLADLKKLVKGTHITVVLGTWCGDSQFQVPHFFKVLDEAKIKTDDVKIICVDGSKHAENGIIDQMNISRVPTIIFTDKDNKEIGRITEHPVKSIEADMHDILAKAK